MGQEMTEETHLLLLEYQSAWDMYRFLFGMRFDLMKYFVGFVFAIAGITPVVLSYVKSQGIVVQTDYIILLILVTVSGILVLLALLTYGLLVNWNEAVEQHHRNVEIVRKQVFGMGSLQTQLFLVKLPEDPAKDRMQGRILKTFISSKLAMEFVAMLFLFILLLINWIIAVWLFTHTCVAPICRFVPFLSPLLLTIVSVLVLVGVKRIRRPKDDKSKN